MWFLAVPLVALVLVALEGVLFQVSVALTGESAPRLGSAVLTAILGAIVGSISGGAFGLTAGLVLAFFSRRLAAILGGLVTLGMVSLVYKRRLRTSLVHALVVAALHEVMSVALLGGVTWLWRLL